MQYCGRALVRRLLAGLLSLSLFLSAYAQPSVLRVADQVAFDSLDVTVKRFLEGAGTRLLIQLDSGVYHYREHHLALVGWDVPEKQIRIVGRNASLLPASVLSMRVYDPDAARFRCQEGVMEAVPEIREMHKAHSLVRIVDRKNKLCRLRTDRVQDPALARGCYLYLTQWFTGRAYPITEVRGRYLYFRVDDLRPARLFYSVNLDWTFSFQYPRYCILGDPSTKENGWDAAATTFLSLDQARLGGVVLDSLRFVGNRRGEDSEGLISVSASDTPFRIRKCRFEQIRSTCITVCASDSIVVEDCQFQDVFRGCVEADAGSSRVSVIGNLIHSAGLAGENTSCIVSYGEGFEIRDNVISDYGYAAIRTGVHYAEPKKRPVTGVIAGNEIFQTPSYFKAAPDRLLMDSGAIYLSTQLDDLLIERNRIHDINGPTYNRGIFADDGASHIRIVGNTIQGIRNYYAIDIDPRSAWKMLHRRERRVSVANEDIDIHDNQVEGKVRIARRRMRRRY